MVSILIHNMKTMHGIHSQSMPLTQFPPAGPAERCGHTIPVTISTL
jgi:hypothetical protein